MTVKIANREDPDQTASSDLSLHCLCFGRQLVFQFLHAVFFPHAFVVA